MHLHSSPYFPQLQAHCLTFPSVTEEYPWGDIAYKVNGRIFAAVDKTTPLQVTVKADPSDSETLLQHPAITKASYVGRYGWVTVTVEDEDVFNLALGLVEVSYGLVKKGRGK